MTIIKSILLAVFLVLAIIPFIVGFIWDFLAQSFDDGRIIQRTVSNWIGE